MKWKKDITLGYMYCIDKDSPYADPRGRVYQHRYEMGKSVGRVLETDECVHHIDRDRSNNRLDNLLLLTSSEHTLLHAIEDRGYSPEVRACKTCGSTFKTSTAVNQKYCNYACAGKAIRRFEISPEHLHTLVWTMPTTKVAELLGVSDVAIAKRCKVLGVAKPPRGYWRKVETNNISTLKFESG